MLKINALVFPLVWARYQIRALLSQQFILVRTSRREAENLITAISAVVPQEDFTAGIDDVDRVVEATEIQNIKDALSQFEAVLSAEMAIAPVFSVPSRGLYNIPDLIDNAQLAIPEKLRGLVLGKALEDWRQGGRCLAFDNPRARPEEEPGTLRRS
jgi:hypothetical protein